MSTWIRDQRVFWKEFRSSYHTTGAVAPSGRLLANSLARYVRQGTSSSTGSNRRRVLEVGPGTGAVTAGIIRALRPDDELDLVELNDQFVERLRERFAGEPAFAAVSSRARVLHQRVEDLPHEATYDLIVSGLPLNNFNVEDVERILAIFQRLLKPGGTLSFFEYIAIRQARALVGNRRERDRLRGISQALDRLLGPHEIRRDWVWPNIPPAWVHHVRIKTPA